MDAYIYCGDVYCESCTGGIMEDLVGSALDNGDSDTYPQGPFPYGGGEADSPQHCGGCGAFLENPLTPDGDEYVTEAVAAFRETGQGAEDIIDTWVAYYDYLNL